MKKRINSAGIVQREEEDEKTLHHSKFFSASSPGRITKSSKRSVRYER